MSELTVKRKVGVRKGKRVVRKVCPPGFRKSGNNCVRVGAAKLLKKKRSAKKAARKRKPKQRLINRKRIFSYRKRKVLGLN